MTTRDVPSEQVSARSLSGEGARILMKNLTNVFDRLQSQERTLN